MFRRLCGSLCPSKDDSAADLHSHNKKVAAMTTPIKTTNISTVQSSPNIAENSLRQDEYGDFVKALEGTDEANFLSKVL